MNGKAKVIHFVTVWGLKELSSHYEASAACGLGPMQLRCLNRPGHEMTHIVTLHSDKVTCEHCLRALKDLS